jgi:hypothetical protein
VWAPASFVAKRQDVDAQSFATIDAPDYTVARLCGLGGE